MNMVDGSLKFDTINDVLLSRSPELKDLIEKKFGSYYNLATEMPDAYPIFEDVVQGLVLELLLTGENESLLTRLFGLFNEMASSPDGAVRDLLTIAIIQPLVYQLKSIIPIQRYMGPEMTRLAKGQAKDMAKRGIIPPA
jgi:hypothetical protein